MNQTNRWAGSVFRGFQGRTAGSQEGKALINVGNVGEGVQGKKTPVGKKCPLQTVALAVDEKAKAIKSSQGRAQSWWRPSRA